MLGVVALLAAALVLHTAVSAHLAFVRTPAPVPQRPVGVALVSNITFGTLTLNSHRLSGPPPQAVTLRAGTNVIELAAPPFATRQCRVSWPSLAVLSGRCTVGAGYVPAMNPALDVEYQITLDFDGRDLPPDAAAAARSALDTDIGAQRLQTAVPAGHLIATGWTPHTGAIASVIVAQPAQAQLSFAPSGSNASDCPAGLCAGADFIPGFYGQVPPGGSAWMLSVSVSYTWRFSTQSGARMASVNYPSDALADIALVLNSDGSGWHLWQPTPPAADSAPRAALASTVCDWASVFRVALPGVPSPASVSTTIGQGIEGCIFQLQSVNGQMAGSLLWRFGVLLASDDLAHERFPALPLASSGEIRAVVGR